mmetsp:Transcript_146559/g.468111  ORF Transcript_146559/g.468111 Transcript_146559/m.468111 type:complete len:210 (-) Transcript_146559:94-723(-)
MPSEFVSKRRMQCAKSRSRKAPMPRPMFMSRMPSTSSSKLSVPLPSLSIFLNSSDAKCCIFFSSASVSLTVAALCSVLAVGPEPTPFELVAPDGTFEFMGPEHLPRATACSAAGATVSDPHDSSDSMVATGDTGMKRRCCATCACWDTGEADGANVAATGVPQATGEAPTALAKGLNEVPCCFTGEVATALTPCIGLTMAVPWHRTAPA